MVNGGYEPITFCMVILITNLMHMLMYNDIQPYIHAYIWYMTKIMPFRLNKYNQSLTKVHLLKLMLFCNPHNSDLVQMNS